MQATRPYVLSIAGFDPSGGAGVLADCKAFEQYGVYGFGVCTAWTVQTDDRFVSIRWMRTEEILEQLQPLIDKFKVSACKIGIIPSLETLRIIIQVLKEHNPSMPIVWDPVLKASAGYDFHSITTFQHLEAVLPQITLLTPNYNELQQLERMVQEPLIKAARAVHTAVLLKGGHRPDAIGIDTLYEATGNTVIEAGVAEAWPKHGSGCVLSAAITANLAKGATLADACKQAKHYVENYLNSNQSLLGYHTTC